MTKRCIIPLRLQKRYFPRTSDKASTFFLSVSKKMFNPSVGFFAAIVNLAFVANCNIAIKPNAEDSDSLDNGEPNRPNRQNWEFEAENISVSSNGMDQVANFAVLPIRPYPTNDAMQKKLFFYLYTKKNPTTPHNLKMNSRWQLQTSNFNAFKLTVFITHGWISTGNSASCISIRDAYLAGVDDVNVIIVDWSAFSMSLYSWSVESLEPVGKEIANLINWLKSIGHIRFDSTTLVGHSLGAHLMGIVGRNTNGVINQIFGLDPASVLFENPSKLRIWRDCARQVQIIHTNGNQLGLLEPIGHSDFYPNGGMNQPSCYFDEMSFGVCSHGRSFEYFAESLNTPIGFKGLRCKIGQSPYNGECTGRVAIMGGRSNNINYRGRYYTKTASASPYALRLIRKTMN